MAIGFTAEATLGLTNDIQKFTFFRKQIAYMLKCIRQEEHLFKLTELLSVDIEVDLTVAPYNRKGNENSTSE